LFKLLKKKENIDIIKKTYNYILDNKLYESFAYESLFLLHYFKIKIKDIDNRIDYNLLYSNSNSGTLINISKVFLLYIDKIHKEPCCNYINFLEKRYSNYE